jgi:hypothetical protein
VDPPLPGSPRPLGSRPSGPGAGSESMARACRFGLNEPPGQAD